MVLINMHTKLALCESFLTIDYVFKKNKKIKLEEIAEFEIISIKRIRKILFIILYFF